MLHDIVNAYRSEDPELIEAAEQRLAAEECRDTADAAFKIASAVAVVEELQTWCPSRMTPNTERAVRSLLAVLKFLAIRPEGAEASKAARHLYGI